MCVENAQNWLKDEEIPHDTAVYICKPEDRVTDQNKLTLVNADISELPPLPNFPGHPSRTIYIPMAPHRAGLMLIVFIGMGIAPQNKRIKMQSWGSDEKHDGGYNIFQGESALIA